MDKRNADVHDLESDLPQIKETKKKQRRNGSKVKNWFYRKLDASVDAAVDVAHNVYVPVRGKCGGASVTFFTLSRN